jgi:hypothetical protein
MPRAHTRLTRKPRDYIEEKRDQFSNIIGLWVNIPRYSVSREMNKHCTKESFLDLMAGN